MEEHIWSTHSLQPILTAIQTSIGEGGANLETKTSSEVDKFYEKLRKVKKEFEKFSSKVSVKRQKNPNRVVPDLTNPDAAEYEHTLKNVRALLANTVFPLTI